ncbi:MAG: DNA polymerase III subunit delta' [Gammaproteobacteria bacterium]
MDTANNNERAFLPWWKTPWRAVVEQMRGDRIPHALLIAGPDGLGKRDFSREIARALTCRETGPDGRACGHCMACALDASGNHPDHIGVYLQEDASEIRVDQIRALTADLALKSHGGGYKVAILNPADRMNPNAANSLLKTLEEPTDNTVLLLISENPARLPATIRSRCQRIRMEPPDNKQALDWLERHGVDGDRELLLRIAAGSPLRAKEFAESNIMELRQKSWNQLDDLAKGVADPLEIAEQWAQGDVMTGIGWFTDWLMDMIRLKLSPAPPMLRNPDLQESFRDIAGRIDHGTLFSLLDQALEARRLASTPVNRRLLVEAQLIAWTEANCRRPQAQ